MPEFEIVSGYVPGALGRIVELHGAYYHRHWNFGLYFEAKAATEMAEFLGRFDLDRDGFWTAQINGEVLGGISIDGKDFETEGARLRWFVLDEAYQGQGIGKKLLDEAVNFCRRAGFKRVYLTTFAGLDAARALYERVGFRLCHEEEDNHWGSTVLEQKFELFL